VAYTQDREFVLADIPGLIEGAHEGIGLGHQFLSHVERCKILLHLVDGTIDDVAGAYRTIREELIQYGHGLADKPEIVALNKCALTDAGRDEKRDALAGACGADVLAISAVSGLGVSELTGRILDGLPIIEVEDADDEPATETAEGWSP
jgi:GTP-binding protein